MENKLPSLTEKLVTYNQYILKKYEETKESGEEGDFFKEVKPFADSVKEINDAWRTAALDWLGREKPRNLHPNQIDTVHEHLEQLSVQAFYPQTSRKRFLDSSKSIEYVLTVLLNILNK